MLVKSTVIFINGNVQVRVTVEHHPSEDPVEKAQNDLSFTHDIDVVFMGDWKVEVSREQP